MPIDRYELGIRREASLLLLDEYCKDPNFSEKIKPIGGASVAFSLMCVIVENDMDYFHTQLDEHGLVERPE